MRRRERHLNIIKSWGGFYDRLFRYHFDRLIGQHGLDALTDEAVEDFARRLVSGHRATQAINKRNREIAARQNSEVRP